MILEVFKHGFATLKPKSSLLCGRNKRKKQQEKEQQKERQEKEIKKNNKKNFSPPALGEFFGRQRLGNGLKNIFSVSASISLPTFNSKVSDEWKNSNYYCGVRLHVLNAAKLIAIWGLALAIFNLLFLSFFSAKNINMWEMLLQNSSYFLHSFVMFFVHGSLLGATLNKKIPSFFCLPFLLFNTFSFCLVLQKICSILSLLVEWPILTLIFGENFSVDSFVAILEESDREEDWEIALVSINLLLLWLLLLVLVAIFLCWLQFVVLRAFIFLNEMSKKNSQAEDYRSVYCADPPRNNWSRRVDGQQQKTNFMANPKKQLNRAFSTNPSHVWF